MNLFQTSEYISVANSHLYNDNSLVDCAVIEPEAFGKFAQRLGSDSMLFKWLDIGFRAILVDYRDDNLRGKRR